MTILSIVLILTGFSMLVGSWFLFIGRWAEMKDFERTHPTWRRWSPFWSWPWSIDPHVSVGVLGASVVTGLALVAIGALALVP